MDFFFEIVRKTEARVQQMKPGWADLERISRKHPKEMAELLREDGIYWRRVYRHRYRKLEKRYREALRNAEFRTLLAEVASQLDRAAVAAAAEKDLLLEEVRLRHRRIELSLAELEEIEMAVIQAERNLRWEEFVLRASYMAAQEAARNGKDPYSAFCRAYVTARRDREPDFLARLPSRLLEPVEKKVTLAQLVGHAMARVSLQYHRRLREAWKKEHSEEYFDTRERLRRELPGAVADAWDAWTGATREKRARFLGYVDKALSSLLDEADRLKERLRGLDEDEVAVQKPRLKVRGLGPLPPEEMLGVRVQRDSHDRGEGELRRAYTAPPEGDEDLMEFERQETLASWVKNARFAKREAQVYELDIWTNCDTKAIARALEIDENTVRGYRKRYQDKLRLAARL